MGFDSTPPPHPRPWHKTAFFESNSRERYSPEASNSLSNHGVQLNHVERTVVQFVTNLNGVDTTALSSHRKPYLKLGFRLARIRASVIKLGCPVGARDKRRRKNAPFKIALVRSTDLAHYLEL
jgi:hypothetical protein